jgi:hypothetical protein
MFSCYWNWTGLPTTERVFDHSILPPSRAQARTSSHTARIPAGYLLDIRVMRTSARHLTGFPCVSNEDPKSCDRQPGNQRSSALALRNPDSAFWTEIVAHPVHLILSAGTRLATRNDVNRIGGGSSIAAGAVAVIIESSSDANHAYKVRFNDGAEAMVRRSEFSILKRV